MYVDNLVLEVTRQCNASCDHCLRGDAQSLKMSEDVIKSTLCHIDSIGTLTLTGGEVSLAVDVIEIVLENLNKYNITVDSFYCVTNGKEPSEDLAIALLKLYAYCDSNEVSQLEVSRDQYHFWGIGYVQDAVDFYKALTFFNEQGRTSDIRYVINEGRAKENGIGDRDESINLFTGEKDDDSYADTVYENLYVSANGNVISNCDISFNRIDSESFGNVLTKELPYICGENMEDEE